MEETKGSTKKVPKNIDLRYADLVFLVCYFVSGILDSSAYNAWTCFVSMQTGESEHTRARVLKLEVNAFG
jgi:hypothetical protein